MNLRKELRAPSGELRAPSGEITRMKRDLRRTIADRQASVRPLSGLSVRSSGKRLVPAR